jgi:hypothetical protein
MTSTASGVIDSASLPAMCGNHSGGFFPTYGVLAPLLHQHSASPVIPDLPPPRHLACLSLPAIHGVVIKSQFPYTLDLQAHNYTKWHTLFSMMLGRFNLLHHVEDDATYPDLEWTKENLLVGQWIYSTISENLFDSA